MCLILFRFDRFVQQKLGGPSASVYENLQAEMSDLQIKYNQLLAAHQEICKEVLFGFSSLLVLWAYAELILKLLILRTSILWYNVWQIHWWMNSNIRILPCRWI